MGILEWVGAHLLGPLVSLYRTFHNKPRPELKIHELVPTGGGSGVVDFRLVVQNVGTQSARCAVTARVDETPVQVATPMVELLPNSLSQEIQVLVPRPQLGELVKAFNSETTLYGRTLFVEVVDGDGKHRATGSWSEPLYTEENRGRQEIQAREWRLGRGEATEADIRADLTSEAMRAYDERNQ